MPHVASARHDRRCWDNARASRSLHMNPGIVYAALAYAAWGLFPLYFRQLNAVDAFEIVLHRTVWSLVFVLLLLSVLHRWAWLPATLRRRRAMAIFALSALLLSGNWLVYV